MKLPILATALIGTVLCFTGWLPFGSGTAKAPDEVQTLWYPSGQVKSRAEVEDGVREGPATEWFANGQERASGAYHDGLREGPWIFHTEDGAIDAERSGDYRAGVRTES